MLGQRTNETLAAARNLLHSKGNWPWANDIRAGLEALLASTLEGTALSKEFQLEAPTAWPENTVMWVFLPLGNTGISVPGPYPVADRTRERDSTSHTRKLAASCFLGSAGDCGGSADNSLSFHKETVLMISSDFMSCLEGNFGPTWRVHWGKNRQLEPPHSPWGHFGGKWSGLLIAVDWTRSSEGSGT